MIKISIKKQEKLTHQGTFESQELADQWLAKHKGLGTFGANEVYSKQPIVLSPAVYEEQQVLVKEAELDEEGKEISPAEYESQQVLVSPEVLEMEQILVKEAVLDENGEELEPAEYKEQPKLVDVLVSPAEYEVEIEDISTKLEQEKINAEAQAFLDATDWMVVRAVERGEELSPEFKAERQAARDRIIK